MTEQKIEAKIVTRQEKRQERKRFAPSWQVLIELLDYTTQKDNNRPAQEALKRLYNYIKSGDLDDNDVPVKYMMSAIREFQSGRINEDELLVQLLWRLENFGAMVRDIGISDEIAKLARELEIKELELAKKAIISEIDFKEIPAPNKGGGKQDTFEHFARDFLEAIQFYIMQGPGRGADAGRDLIVVGKEPNGQNEQELRWLVSCKHFAHSLKQDSVSPTDEKDITTRVLQVDGDAFMGFYSTLPTSGLITRLDELKKSKHYSRNYFIFDRGKISVALLADTRLEPVLEQYFPRAYRRKKQGQIEINFELLQYLWEGERKLRTQQATTRNEVRIFKRAQREYKTKTNEAQKRRAYLLKQLGDEKE